jgi:spermidine synthase
MTWFFIFFLISGFCSILYELVWLRLAMALFTVTTPFVSIFLSVFMLGLGFGSWQAGRFAERRVWTAARALRLYALTELFIGASAILFSRELAWSRGLLERLAGNGSFPIAGFYAASAVAMVLILAPWCACMGATFPFAMAAVKARRPDESARSFSWLYLANISGAVLGSIAPLVLIEEWGFHGTLRVGLALNLSLAGAAFVFSRSAQAKDAIAAPARTPWKGEAQRSTMFLWLLFAAGLTTMAVEVVWVRLYTAYLGTVVYAFGAILASYLLATYIGSKMYRARTVRAVTTGGGFLTHVGLSVMLVLIACDPRESLPALLRLPIGIMLFSGAAGFLTPLLLDRYSNGDPGRAGRGYAVNILGCVAGPLLAGFVLLPLVGERLTLTVLAFPWLIAGLLFDWAVVERKSTLVWRFLAALATMLALVLFTKGWEESYSPRMIRRDSTATVVAAGRGQDKRLLVNGVGMTTLTSITKAMAHLPLAFLAQPPRTAAVICFGMGTTHRSILSWGIHSTVVELVPSVPRLFGYFHPDGPQLLASPISELKIDDGRFFLARTRESYDAIIIDPPPPVEAAASSLLYSKEFYATAKPRLKPGGILAQWLPGGDAATQASVAKALQQSFPYVRVFKSVKHWGWHFLASSSPIESYSAKTLAARMPAAAAADLVEWGPESNAEAQFGVILSQPVALDDLISQDPGIPALQDDRPINEYFLLRRLTD